jgi:hypothetical protein
MKLALGLLSPLSVIQILWFLCLDHAWRINEHVSFVCQTGTWVRDFPVDSVEIRGSLVHLRRLLVLLVWVDWFVGCFDSGFSWTFSLFRRMFKYYFKIGYDHLPKLLSVSVHDRNPISFDIPLQCSSAFWHRKPSPQNGLVNLVKWNIHQLKYWLKGSFLFVMFYSSVEA